MPAPIVPNVSVRMVDDAGRVDVDYRLFFLALVRAIPVQGTATFAAGTSIAVTFAAPEMDTNYRIVVEPVANRTYWITSKTSTGFTLNASGSNSDTIFWSLIRA